LGHAKPLKKAPTHFEILEISKGQRGESGSVRLSRSDTFPLPGGPPQPGPNAHSHASPPGQWSGRIRAQGSCQTGLWHYSATLRDRLPLRLRLSRSAAQVLTLSSHRRPKAAEPRTVPVPTPVSGSESETDSESGSGSRPRSGPSSVPRSVPRSGPASAPGLAPTRTQSLAFRDASARTQLSQTPEGRRPPHRPRANLRFRVRIRVRVRNRGGLRL
jgi:hypothetical protein